MRNLSITCEKKIANFVTRSLKKVTNILNRSLILKNLEFSQSLTVKSREVIQSVVENKAKFVSRSLTKIANCFNHLPIIMAFNFIKHHYETFLLLFSNLSFSFFVTLRFHNRVPISIKSCYFFGIHHLQNRYHTRQNWSNCRFRNLDQIYFYFPRKNSFHQHASF